MYAGISLDQAPPEDIPIRFFITAPLFGLLAALTIIVEGQNLFITHLSLETVALTHMITLGWLAMIMFGSFYQMVPVLVGEKAPCIKAARYVHALLTLGALIFVTGLFFQQNTLMITAGALLAPALFFFIAQILIPLFKTDGSRPTVAAMRISVVSLFIVTALGLLFTGAFADLWELPADRINISAVHIIFALFGWVMTLIIGVGFHVIPMFYMTPDFPVKKAQWILRLIGATLILTPLLIISETSTALIISAGIPGMTGIALFIHTIFSLLDQRKRKIMDTPLKFWRYGLYMLAVALAPLILTAFDTSTLSVFGFGIFFIFGFAVSITNGMLYKIVPFLIWFHRFSLLIGRTDLPLMSDISPDKYAKQQWRAFLIFAPLLFFGVVVGSDMIIRAAGGVFMISSGMFLYRMFKMTQMKVPAD